MVGLMRFTYRVMCSAILPIAAKVVQFLGGSNGVLCPFEAPLSWIIPSDILPEIV